MKSRTMKVNLEVNYGYSILTWITVPFVVEDEVFDDIRPPEFTVKYLDRAANEIEADEARLLAEFVSLRTKAATSTLGDTDVGSTWWVVPVRVRSSIVIYVSRIPNVAIGRKGRNDGEAHEGSIT